MSKFKLLFSALIVFVLAMPAYAAAQKTQTADRAVVTVAPPTPAPTIIAAAADKTQAAAKTVAPKAKKHKAKAAKKASKKEAKTKKVKGSSFKLKPTAHVMA